MNEGLLFAYKNTSFRNGTLAATRLPGHFIRVDVLVSAVQKGIRRCDARVALWAVAALCRGGLWRVALRAVLASLYEDTNAFTEPTLRERCLRLALRLHPQLA